MTGVALPTFLLAAAWRKRKSPSVRPASNIRRAIRLGRAGFEKL